jgi:hypothetical protein
MEKAAKKTSKKKKNSRFAATLTLRIEKPKIKPFDELLAHYGKKSYTDVIFKAVSEVKSQHDHIAKLQDQIRGLSLELREALTFKSRFTELIGIALEPAGEKKKSAQKTCRYCDQTYIDTGEGCPECD